LSDININVSVGVREPQDTEGAEATVPGNLIVTLVIVPLTVVVLARSHGEMAFNIPVK
jgi:hypothetical protein